MANFLIQGQTTRSSGPISSIIKFIRALVVIYKFGDRLIFVDASVNKQIVDGRRTDGQRRKVSDHNSSLGTPCSGELNMLSTYRSFI